MSGGGSARPTAWAWRHLGRAASLLGLAATVACRGPGETWERPVLRISEGEAPARVDTETRYAVPAHRQVLLFDEPRLRVLADGSIPLARALPAPLAGAERVLLATRVRTDENQAWTELPALLAHVDDRDGGARIGVRARAAGLAGREVALLATGFEPAPAGRTIVRSPELVLPEGAWFEAAVAVLEPARSEGAVRFELLACEGDGCERLFAETVDPAETRGWRELRVPLAALAGRRRAIELRTELVAKGTGAVSLPVWSNPTIYARGPAGDGPRGLLLLSIDTLRADHLSSYGHPFDTAPFVERELARAGVLFEHTMASATTTGPAHMTMFTSLQPLVHGLTDRPSPRPPAPVTLAELLRAHGLRTGAVTEDGPLHAGWGFGRGFESYAENVSPNLMLPEGQISDTLAKGEAWLRANAHRPFFLFLHTFQVHFPYRPPEAYAGLFTGEEPPPPGLPPAYDPTLYDREIRYVDDSLHSLFRTLAELGLLEHTVVVFTSDHGEEFLEHGFLGHGAHLHPEVLDVPLIVRGPGLARGRRIRAPVAHVDLMPTLLELLGAPVPAGLMGRSLVPLLRSGSETPAGPARPLYSEAWYPVATGPDGVTSRVEQPSFSVRSGDRKLVQLHGPAGPAYRYFDLARDPGERTDRYAELADEAADLRALLDAYPARANDLRAVAEQVRARFDANGATEAEPAIDPAVREKLRALGYVD